MENTPNLTSGHAPELEKAIARTHAGQVGWAGWYAPDAFCGECIHFARGREWIPQARCHKRQQLDVQHRKGKRVPCTARACRYWEARKR
jgi:hypothetical protein